MIRAAVDAGLRADRRHVPPAPAEVLGNRVELLATLERRLELLAELRRRGDARRRVHAGVARLAPEDVRAATTSARSAPRSSSCGDRLSLRPPARSGDSPARRLGFGARDGPARRRRVVDAHPRAREGDVRGAARAARAAVRGGGRRRRGRPRGGTLGFPTANLARRADLLVPAFGIYAGAALDQPRGDVDRRQPALRRRRAEGRGVPARLRRRPLRRAPRRRALGAPPRRGGVRRARPR